MNMEYLVESLFIIYKIKERGMYYMQEKSNITLAQVLHILKEKKR